MLHDVTALLPPELMTPEDRELRIEQLEREIGREWLRYAITEAVVVFLPFFAFVIVYLLTDAIPDRALVPAIIAAGAL